VIDAAPVTEQLTPLIKAQALGLGFDLVGVTRTGPVSSSTHFDRWIADGRAGAMTYMERHADIRRDTRLPFEGAVSAVVVALDYGGRQRPGPIARYARGDDYHDVMRAKLDQLHGWIDDRLGSPVRGRSYVDTGPILERDLARRAGLGWFGKNTNLIHPDRGSFFFIGALFLALELDEDAPFEADRCGTCTRCLDACPTSALTAPRTLDATRCISYLTIELRDAIPVELREPMRDLIYGCDICQDVCPFNVKFAEELKVREFNARAGLTDDARSIARRLLGLNQAGYAEAFRGSAMKRAKLRGLRRNAAVALGNVGNESDVALLRDAGNADDLVREHADWAVERITSRAACSD
jgi:epoxyqueuosine reductase